MWSLWIALGLVLLVMRNLQQPETARRIGQLFPTDVQQAGQLAASKRIAPVDTSDIDLSSVEDNTPFRTKEQTAWFALFAKLQAMRPQQLASSSISPGMPELTYAQLLGQPDVYRGHLVTIRGTVLREEIQLPAENSLGIESYHRLWLQPTGGGRWPMVVYCLELPKEFPRGDDIRAAIAVRGFFFKNWSYSWQNRLGLAPVVVAKQIEWSPPVPRPTAEPPTKLEIGLAVAGAVAVAGLAVWLALKSTKRRSSAAGQGRGGASLPEKARDKLAENLVDDEEIRRQLQQLAQTESDL